MSGLARALEADGHELLELPGLALPVVAPADEEAVGEVMRRAARDRLRVLPVGGGSQLARLRPEALSASPPLDLVLSTRRLGGIEYERGDGTVTAGAGTPLDELARTVEAGGHRLTPDVPRPASRTLGGVVAAGDSGADRLRLGPVRHHVPGTRVVGADGLASRSGGRLVKNVTGFDLHRLYTGSRGTLAVLTQVSLRLFPLPEASWTLELTGQDLRVLLAVEERLRSLAPSPTATWLRCAAEGTFELLALLDGRRATVEQGREAFLDAAREGAPGLEPLEREGEEARRRAAELRDGQGSRPPSLVLECLPSQVGGGALDNLRSFCDARGVPLEATAWPGVARVEVHLPPGLAADAEALGELRDQVAAAEVRLELGAVPQAVHEHLGRPLDPAARAWMERLSRGHDPKGLLASPLFP